MISIANIEDLAEKAIRANYALRHARAFSDKSRQDRIVAERKRQIREWAEVLRIVREPMNHPHVIAKLTDNGTFSGRNLPSHAIRNRIILAGLEMLSDDELAERAEKALQRQTKRNEGLFEQTQRAGLQSLRSVLSDRLSEADAQGVDVDQKDTPHTDRPRG